MTEEELRIKITSIQTIVRTAVEAFASGFSARHIGEVNNPDGTLNMKIHNVFIEALGDEIQYYTALARSLDSSLGNMLEGMAMNIGRLSYVILKNVSGPLSQAQTSRIATILEAYKRRTMRPTVEDYQILRTLNPVEAQIEIRHDSDYYLIDEADGSHHLIELKIGGDLDNKKARSEKEAILEQFAILSNTLPENTIIKCYFATAYNRFGDGNVWKQERVKQFFATEELLIGRDFWNFITKLPNGYEIVLEAYREHSHFICDSLEKIKKEYL